VEVNNTSGRNIETVEVEFSTYDTKNKVESSTSTYVHAIPAGDLGAGEAFADLFETEVDVGAS
jgi:hypothetical protein